MVHGKSVLYNGLAKSMVLGKSVQYNLDWHNPWLPDTAGNEKIT